MRFSEAMTALEDGKKIKQKNWESHNYLYAKDGMVYDQTHNPHFFVPKVIGEAWELYDDQVSVGELRAGDLFEYSGDTFRVCPAYMMEYIKRNHIPANGVVAVWHDTGYKGTFCHFPKNTKVKKVNE